MREMLNKNLRIFRNYLLLNLTLKFHKDIREKNKCGKSE